MGIELVGRGAKKEKAEDLVQRVAKRFEAAASFRRKYEANWREYTRLYRSIIDEIARQTQNRRATLFVPQMFAQIETIVPRMVASIFASRPYVGAVPKGAETTLDQALAMEYLIDHQVGDRIKLRRQAGPWLREAAICGMAPAYVGWRREVRRLKVRRPVMEMQQIVGYQLVEEDVVTYDDPIFEPIDVFNFYWDPAAVGPDCVEKARYIIHRSEVTKEYLEQMVEQMVFDKKGVKAALDAGKGEFVQSGTHTQRLADLGHGSPEDDTEDPIFELLACWENDRVIAVLDRKHLVRAESNPFSHGRKPYVVAKFIPVLHEFSGIPIPEAAKSPQYELNEWRNIRMDNAVLRMHTPFMKLESIEIGLEDLILGPGEIIEVPTFDALKQLEIADMSRSGYQEEEYLKGDIMTATGANEVMRGLSPGNRATATEVASRVEQGSFRMDDMRINVEETGFIPAIEMIGAMNQQFMNHDKVIHIAGPEGAAMVAVAPEAIAGQFDFSFMGSSTEPIVNRDLHRQQWTQLAGTLVNMPNVKVEEVVKRLLQVYDVRQPERFVMSPEEQMQKAITAFLQAQGQQQPGQGQPQPGGMPGVQA